MSIMSPSYLQLYKTGEIHRRVSALYKMLESCTVCPRNCKVNRLKGEIGKCRSTEDVVISSVSPHYGEEPPLVGYGGSGTIFLTNCNLACIYCQNYDISHLKAGQKVELKELATAMILLQNRGCHNINLVTPTHFTPQIVKSLILAIEMGLTLPIVYNCGGYESVETLKLLDGIVDIYMPDVKYSSNDFGKKYSGVPDYFDVVKKALKEMYRQVGDLKMSDNGIAYRGLLIRHLVLPNDLAGSREVLSFIANEISKNSYLNIMDQYRPEYKAYKHKELNRRITMKEYNDVVEMAKEFGLRIL